MGAIYGKSMCKDTYDQRFHFELLDVLITGL